MAQTVQIQADRTIEPAEIIVEATGDLIVVETVIVSAGGVELHRGQQRRRVEIERDISAEPDPRVRVIGAFVRTLADNKAKPAPITRSPRVPLP